MTRPGAIAIDLPPPPAGAVAVASGLREAGHEAFFVGGGVRDRILGRAVNDWDVATDAEPEAVMACFDKTIATGLQHGTVTVMQGPLPIEVTTYRVERGYSDGRRPDEVLYTRVLEDDLSRRDFTVNAMAWDPIDGVLVDPFGGRADLERKVLRAVGRAVERFSEDGLRALRAVRFACVLDLRIDPETEAAIPDTLDTFRKVSAERIRVELGKILKVPRAGWGVDGLLRTGLLAEFLPEVAGLSADDVAGATRALAAIDGEVPRLAALLHASDSDGEAPMRRLKYSTDERRRLMHLLSFRAVEPAAERDDAAVRALVADIEATHPGALDALVAYRRELGAADAWDALAARVDALGARTGPLRTKDLSLNGKAVMQHLGIPPSRRVGRILDVLLRRVWVDPSLDTPDGLRAILPEVAAEVPA